LVYYNYTRIIVRSITIAGWLSLSAHLIPCIYAAIKMLEMQNIVPFIYNVQILFAFDNNMHVILYYYYDAQLNNETILNN